MMVSLGEALNITPGMTPEQQYAWAQGLVSEDYCKRLACGAVQQSEAGTEKMFACGLAYPMQPQGWCSDFCLPYRDEIEARYGKVCGGEQSLEDVIYNRPQPSIIPMPTGTEPILPRDLFIPNRRTDAELECGVVGSQGYNDSCCVLSIGCCCFTMNHLLALGVIGLAFLWRKN